jgi:hypothetical protein
VRLPETVDGGRVYEIFAEFGEVGWGEHAIEGAAGIAATACAQAASRGLRLFCSAACSVVFRGWRR